MRRWREFLNPSELGLPLWCRTFRPLSHVAPGCVTYHERGELPPLPDRVHVLPSELEFYRLLDMAVWERLPSPPWAEGPVLGRPTWHEGATITHRGFKAVPTPEGGRRVLDGYGGVLFGDDVELGAGTCIDRGLVGECTELGNGVKMDNLVHVGHSCLIGDETLLPAGTTLSGWTEIGARCWLGVGVLTLPHVKIGDGCYVGAGTLVNRDVPPHSLVYGTPARIKGGACCHRVLTFEGTLARCPNCQREYGLVDGRVIPLGESGVL